MSGLSNRPEPNDMNGNPPKGFGRVRMSIEVEYVRSETIEFVVNPDDGFSTVGVPWEVGRFLRTMQFNLHHGKDLVKGESPRLVGWRIIPRRGGATLGCGCWSGKVVGGMAAGQFVTCPEHGQVEIVKCNVDEPDDVYLAAFNSDEGRTRR
jgi:hypothetical protein